MLIGCLQVLLTNERPVLHEPYVQEPFLIDEDRIGGSAILRSRDLLSVSEVAVCIRVLRDLRVCHRVERG